MAISKEDVRRIEAVVTLGRSGWLAVSAPGSKLQIGVVGATEEVARHRFREERSAWERLVEDETATISN